MFKHNYRFRCACAGITGLEADGEIVWTYKHALTPSRMPKKLLVVGSGAIGIEFASFYNTLGADTTVIEVVDRILPAEDAEIAAFALKQFSKQGMKILTNASVKKVERKKNSAHVEIVVKAKQKRNNLIQLFQLLELLEI